PEGGVLAEDLAFELHAQHRHVRAVPRIALREESSLAHAELPDARHVRSDAVDEDAAATLAVLHAGVPERDRHRRLDLREPPQRLGVLPGQLADRTGDRPGRPGGGRLARIDGDEIRPEL